MPTFVTSDKLGKRQIANATTQPQSYQSGMAEGADIEAASQLRQIGRGIQQFGSNITAEEQKKEEKARLVNDSLLEAQIKSQIMQVDLNMTEEFQQSNDYDAFPDKYTKSINDSVSHLLAGVSLENRPFMDLMVKNSLAQGLSRTNDLVRGRRVDSSLSDLAEAEDSTLNVISKTKDFSSYLNIEQQRAAIGAKYPEIKKEAMVKGGIDFRNKAATTYAYALPAEERLRTVNDSMGNFNDNIFEIYKDKMEASGVDVVYYQKVAMVESGGDPNAKAPNSSADGLFQLTDGTTKELGYNPKDRKDPKKNTEMSIDLTSQNYNGLVKNLGRKPSNEEVYLAHQQGLGRAANLIENPYKKVTDVLPDDAILNNGGTLDMTAGDFADMQMKKFTDAKPVDAVYDRQRQGTPFDFLTQAQLTDIRNKSIAEIADSFSTMDYRDIDLYTKSPEFLSLTDEQQFDLKVKANNMIKTKMVLARENSLNSAIMANEGLFEKFQDRTLTYTEIENERIRIESDPEMSSGEKQLQIGTLEYMKGDISLTTDDEVNKAVKDYETKLKIKERTGKADRGLEETIDLNTKYKEVMDKYWKDDEQKTKAEGLTDLLQLSNDLASVGKNMSASDRSKFVNVNVMLRRKMDSLGNVGLFGRKDKLGGDPYVNVYDGINDYFMENIDTPISDVDSKISALSTAVEILKGYEENGTTIDEVNQNAVIAHSMDKFFKSKYPNNLSNVQIGLYPNNIITENGKKIPVPSILKDPSKTPPADMVIKNKPFALLESYETPDGSSFITKEVIQAVAERDKKTPEQVVSLLRQQGRIK